tara:strand:+ start:105 stop:413 length:309 start_codon:yes stop_codon:yes gene_type:complete
MKIFFIFLLYSLILTSCQSAKDVLTLQKKPASDEFLVEKKSPLVLPPNYGELPIPSEEKDIKDQDQNQSVKATLGKDKFKINKTIKNSQPSSLEKSILKKIK